MEKIVKKMHEEIKKEYKSDEILVSSFEDAIRLSSLEVL